MKQTYKNSTFIIGVMNRCGTNFLADLIVNTGLFEVPEYIQEDYFLFYINYIDNYINETCKHWGKAFRALPATQRPDLYSTFGRYLINFGYGCIPPNKTPLFKTPRPNNLSFFKKFFPNSKLVLIMRDGRDVVESAAKTFKYAPYKHWMQNWAFGVDTINNFMSAATDSSEQRFWMYVKYEDLFQKKKETLSRILNFLDVDPNDYPWDSLKSMPVRGSSTNLGGEKEVHWKPVPMENDFKPIGRWQGWDKKTKKLFKKIAGKQLIDTGYVYDNDW